MGPKYWIVEIRFDHGRSFEARLVELCDDGVCRDSLGRRWDFHPSEAGQGGWTCEDGSVASKVDAAGVYCAESVGTIDAQEAAFRDEWSSRSLYSVGAYRYRWVNVYDAYSIAFVSEYSRIMYQSMEQEPPSDLLETLRPAALGRKAC